MTDTQPGTIPGEAIEAAIPPLADHPHKDPGDGRTECETCGKFVWPVTHSCKGVPVTERAKKRHATMVAQRQPPLTDVEYVDACESAHASLMASLRVHGMGDHVLTEEAELWAADIVDAVWPILHAPAYAAGVEAGRGQAMAGMREEWRVQHPAMSVIVGNLFGHDEKSARELAVLYPGAHVEHRHVTEWAEAEQGGRG